MSLLHDVCKIGCYKPSTRNVKGEDGKWTKVPTYQYEDPLPYGHGEKSVYVVNGFVRLTREEAMAIRWHMGFSGTEDAAGRAKPLPSILWPSPCLWLTWKPPISSKRNPEIPTRPPSGKGAQERKLFVFMTTFAPLDRGAHSNRSGRVRL